MEFCCDYLAVAHKHHALYINFIYFSARLAVTCLRGTFRKCTHGYSLQLFFDVCILEKIVIFLLF